MSICDGASAICSSGARYSTLFTPLAKFLRALHLRMLKHIGCSLFSFIGCGDTLAYPGNYYRAFAYCPIPFLPTVRLALLSATSAQRCAGFPSSGIPYFKELGRKAPALRRRRARRTGKDRQPLSLGLCPIFLSRGLLYGAGSNIPLLSCFDASNARTAVACCPVQLKLSLRGCSTATRHSPR